ncbi:MAG TPA: DUF4340 domain-containing protein [Rhodanobacteraceae bacterium]
MTNTRRLIALWGVLVLQILAAIWLWWPRQNGPVTGKAWLHLQPTAVTRIELSHRSGNHTKTLVLQKQAGHWALPDADDFPADVSKVRHLLAALGGLKGTLPVAVTPNAARRFRVARDKFEARVTLDAGRRQLARVYVGNAAGANLVYLRRADSHNIEANRLPSWLVSASASDWRDESELQLPSDSISKLVLPHVTLVKGKAGWTAAGTATALDKAKATGLVDRIAQLDFLDVVGRKPAKAAPPAFTIAVDTNGKTLTYAFDKVALPPAKAGSSKAKPQPRVGWRLTRSDLPFVFGVSGSTVAKLQDASAKTLAATPPSHGKSGKSV